MSKTLYPRVENAVGESFAALPELFVATQLHSAT